MQSVVFSINTRTIQEADKSLLQMYIKLDRDFLLQETYLSFLAFGLFVVNLMFYDGIYIVWKTKLLLKLMRFVVFEVILVSLQRSESISFEK